MKKLATLTLAIAMSCTLVACSSPEPEPTVAPTPEPTVATPSPKPTPTAAPEPTVAPSSETDNYIAEIMREVEEKAAKRLPIGISKTEYIEGMTTYLPPLGFDVTTSEYGGFMIGENQVIIDTVQDSDDVNCISFIDNTTADSEQIIAFAYVSILILENSLSTDEISAYVNELFTNNEYGFGGEIIINGTNYYFSNFVDRMLTIERSAT